MACRFASISTDVAIGIAGRPLSHDIVRRLNRAFQDHIRALFANGPNSSARRFAGFGVTFISHPELFLSAGFEEVRYGAPFVEDPTISDSARGFIDEMLLEAGVRGLDADVALALMKGTQYRTENGMWHDMEGVFDRIVPPIVPNWTEVGGFDEWARFLSDSWVSLIQRNNRDRSVVTLPSLSSVTHLHQCELRDTTTTLVERMRQNDVALERLHWRDLEELVAELLRSMGMKVSVTPGSRDGGRDVIARGELIPGEPTVLAVEVKHRPVVKLPDLRNSLWANKQFPALLFVTSGRFSAGVYREKRLGDNALRLYLKDGCALNQWISAYARRTFE